MKGTKRVAKRENTQIGMKVECVFPKGHLTLGEQQRLVDELKDKIYELLHPSFYYSQIIIQ